MLVFATLAFLVTQVMAAPPGTFGSNTRVITGKVTENLTIVTDDGSEYTAIGSKAAGLMDNIGKEVEIRGNVVESTGRRHLEVEEYTVSPMKTMK